MITSGITISPYILTAALVCLRASFDPQNCYIFFYTAIN
jgi:hypothetical protein